MCIRDRLQVRSSSALQPNSPTAHCSACTTSWMFCCCHYICWNTLTVRSSYSSFPLFSFLLAVRRFQNRKSHRVRIWRARLPCMRVHSQRTRGCRTFEDFLAALKQSKRKSIRQERKSMVKQNLRIERLQGAQITPDIWDAFYSFYVDTTGTPPPLQIACASHTSGRATAMHVLRCYV